MTRKSRTQNRTP